MNTERFARMAQDELARAQPGVVVPPQPLDTVAFVTVRLHQSGVVSTQGTIADKAMALRLLDYARDAIKDQVRDGAIVIPGRDVDCAPSVPTRDMGDIPIAERGDP